MTEIEWLAATEPRPMLEFLRGKVSDRKLLFFAVACCRYVWLDLKSEQIRKAIDVGERLADGEMTTGEERQSDVPALTVTTVLVYSAFAATLASGAVGLDSEIQKTNGAWLLSRPVPERLSQAAILRHLVCNPFRPPPPLLHVPLTVCELAEAVYRQQTEAVGRLHDSLLDAGLTDLAQHFKDAREWHPKGCWALDLMTGRA